MFFFTSNLFNSPHLAVNTQTLVKSQIWPGDSFWDGKYRLRNVLIKLWREGTVLRFRELDLDIQFYLLWAEIKLSLLWPELYFIKKGPSRTPHCLMLDASMHKCNQSKKAFKFHFRIKVRSLASLASWARKTKFGREIGKKKLSD